MTNRANNTQYYIPTARNPRLVRDRLEGEPGRTPREMPALYFVLSSYDFINCIISKTVAAAIE